jgi:nucleotide-binding universal stress UspA family protein
MTTKEVKPMFKHILVPLDGSQLAEMALPTALELAAKFAGKITLLRVTLPPFIPQSIDGRAYADVLVAIREHAHEEADNYLKALKGSLRQQGYTIHAQVLASESPATAILDVVDAQNMDAIVMSTHGRGGLVRWVYGSVADKVLRHADVPVLLVRANADEFDVELPAVANEADIREFA